MTTVTLTGDVIVLATPFDGALQCVADQAGDLAGKVVVDITNPVDWGSFDRLVTPADSSAGEEIAGRLGEGARVVKAFNTTFAGTLVAGEVAGQPLDVFVAADDEGRQAAGLRARGDRRHAGAGRRSVAGARQLELLGFLHMALQDRLGTGDSSGLTLPWLLKDKSIDARGREHLRSGDHLPDLWRPL
ncbi:MAG: 8-hydroxy-5-deazaflavin:NADPH oxidoreductase [Nocardioidaceae bacterium]|nr:8-hydroxy-5-deazaflavin:NADPH oxidoreductase [Nocardioidaceae bacterium]